MAKTTIYDLQVRANNRLFYEGKENFTVFFTKKEYEQIKDYACKIEKKKQNENHYKKDNEKIQYRFLDGLLGEAACYSMLGFDWRELLEYEAGPTRDYNHADLTTIGLNIGVKASTISLAPLISVNNKTSQVICMIRNEESSGFFKSVTVLGLATTENIEAHLARELVKDKKASQDKKGFWGFNYLIPFDCIEDLLLLITAEEHNNYEEKRKIYKRIR